MKSLLKFQILGLLLSLHCMGGEGRPLFRDFVGLNGHTVQFKPGLYQPVCGVVRDYHPVPWDLAKDTAQLPDWPFAKNRVSWEQVYGSWNKAGLKISSCLMIDEMKDGWKDMEKDAHAYGKSFAENFGPGGRWPYVDTVEIGNEPGQYTDEAYLKLFTAMARGIREGNPKLKIATCNVDPGKSDRYWKGVELLKDSKDLYDVLQTHRYAIAEQWPVWRRTYPEDASVPYLSSIRELLGWRDKNAPGKEVWVTEFGWDASTKKPDPKGPNAKWQGTTDADQARWLVRSFLLFSEMGVDKSFVYFFNDGDEPKLHAASGITRNFQPKPSYHALAWMYAALKDHRFSKIIRQPDTGAYLYEFAPEKPDGPVILAAWHPVRDAAVSLGMGRGKILKAEIMPMDGSGAKPANLGEKEDAAEITAGIDPTLIWVAP